MAQAQYPERFQGAGSRAAENLFLKEGTVLQGRYKTDGVLSVSASDQVYRVSDLRFPGNRWVLKVYRKLPSGEFRETMKTLVSFHHPNLVKVVDFFEEENFSCVVTEMVHGRSLERLLEDTVGPLPERQVLSWGVQGADALLYLHANSPGFTHYRNLSPRKILVSTIGELKLLPLVSEILDHSRVRGVMGYAPPEAFDEDKKVDERSDVYTLAAILHRCLTGGNSTAVPFVFVPLDPVNPNLDSAIERILEKATQADPARRYAGLEDFKQEVYRSLQAVIRIQFNLPVKEGFSDAFWWTMIGISGAAFGAWFYIFNVFMKYR